MNNKLVKIGIIGAVLIVLGFAAFSFRDNQQLKKDIITEKDPKLTDSERQTFNDQLAKIEDQLKNASNDEERFTGYIQKGYVLQGLGKLAEAKESFEKALEYKKDDFVVHAALYQINLEMNDPQTAQAEIKRAIELSPKNADLWRKYISLMKEKFGASNDTLNGLYAEALNRTENHVDIITVYAEFLESTKNYQAAIEYWQKASQLNPAGKKIYDAEIKRLQTLQKSQPQ